MQSCHYSSSGTTSFTRPGSWRHVHIRPHAESDQNPQHVLLRVLYERGQVPYVSYNVASALATPTSLLFLYPFQATLQTATTSAALLLSNVISVSSLVTDPCWHTCCTLWNNVASNSPAVGNDYHLLAISIQPPSPLALPLVRNFFTSKCYSMAIILHTFHWKHNPIKVCSNTQFKTESYG